MNYSSVVEAVCRHSLKNPGKLCITDRNSEYTYGEFYDLICSYADYFSRQGIGKDDKVVVEAAQTADFPAVEFGLHLIGAVFVPLENGCSTDKAFSVAEACGASLVIFQNAMAGIKALIVPPPACRNNYTLPEAGSLSEILFSTGTTGKEKGIMLSHANDVAVAENIVCGSGMLEDNIEMIPSPLNHSHGLRSVYANMLCGGTVILHDSILDMKGFFAALDKYKVNAIDLVPSALSIILRFSGKKLGEYRDRFRYLEFGSAAMMPDDKARIMDLLPGIPLLNYYGSTESGRATVFNFNAGTEKAGCIGRPTVNTEAIIVDEHREAIDSSPERTGLLACAGAMNMIGYFNDEDETLKATDGKYVYSSDEAYIDPDGDIILLGRKGDVINVGGKKVSPEEIENVARQHPSVADCGCIGVDDATTGQAPKLFIQLEPGCEFNVRELSAFLSARLEQFKLPKHIEQIDAIPRTFNGKLLRRKLPR